MQDETSKNEYLKRKVKKTLDSLKKPLRDLDELYNQLRWYEGPYDLINRVDGARNGLRIVINNHNFSED